jgi:hypothetical protein
MSREKEQPSTQWHPLFAELLRPMLQDYYDVQTNFAVGDAPRQADIVVLRRTTEGPTPFRGLWRHLTPWNVFEFKGPSVSARLRDLDLLVELGLGVDRRLNEERQRQRQRPMNPEDVSFWYLTNHLGRRFLRSAEQRFGHLEQLGEGLWRSHVMERLVYLVSNTAIPVENDTLPVHLLAQDSVENDLAVVRLIAEESRLWEMYASYMASRSPKLWKEILEMAQRKHKGPQFDIRLIVKEIGITTALDQVIDALGVEAYLKDMEQRKKLFKKLSAEERQKLKALFE